MIRRMHASEENALLVGSFLFETFAQEHRFGGETVPVNPQRAYETIWRMLKHGVVWVAEDGDRIVGSLSIERDRLWWSDTDILVDGWFYIRPDSRDPTLALRLIREARTFADGTPLCIRVFNADDVDRKDAFLRKIGFAPMGGIYLMET